MQCSLSFYSLYVSIVALQHLSFITEPCVLLIADDGRDEKKSMRNAKYTQLQSCGSQNSSHCHQQLGIRLRFSTYPKSQNAHSMNSFTRTHVSRIVVLITIGWDVSAAAVCACLTRIGTWIETYIYHSPLHRTKWQMRIRLASKKWISAIRMTHFVKICHLEQKYMFKIYRSIKRSQWQRIVIFRPIYAFMGLLELNVL